MLSPQVKNNWNNACEPTIVADDVCKSVSSERKTPKFEIQPNSSRIFLRIFKAGWATDQKPQIKKREEPTPEAIEVAKMLRTWREEDSEESRETWEFLEKELDSDRLSNRKFF